MVSGEGGYTIITTSEQSEFMLLSHCKKAAKLGYYFHRLSKAYDKMVILLADIKIGEVSY